MNAKTAKIGDVVIVHITGKKEDDTVFGTSKDGQPIQFEIGKRNVILGLEKAVVGMKPGESKTITVPPEEAFGERKDERIRRSGKKMKMDLEKRKAGIEKQKKRLKQGALLLNKQTLEERKRGIRININDFRLLQKKYTKKLKVIEKKLIGEIEEEVTALIREIGKSKGYILITEQRTGRVLYAPETIDISDQLIRKYNSRLSKEHTLQTRWNKN